MYSSLGNLNYFADATGFDSCATYVSDAVCCLYTCRRLIDLSSSDCRYKAQCAQLLCDDCISAGAAPVMNR